MDQDSRRIRLVRDALAAYAKYGFHTQDKASSWNGISEAIEDATGVKIDGERLRQFVRGPSRRKGVKKYSIPKGIKAIERFLTGDEFSTLSREELEGRVPPFQGPWRLIQYFRRGLEEEFLPPPAQLAGLYSGIFAQANAEITLELETPSEDGMVCIYEESVQYRDASMTGDAGRTVRSSGWGVWTPEDNLLVFLKEVDFHKNHYYFTLALDADLRSGTSFDSLVLVRHDYPFEITTPGADETDKEASLEQIQQQLIFLRRVPEIKSLSDKRQVC